MWNLHTRNTIAVVGAGRMKPVHGLKSATTPTDTYLSVEQCTGNMDV